MRNETNETLETELEGVEQAVAKSLHTHWLLYLIEGIMLIILGAILFVVPGLALIGLSLLLAWVLLINGVIGLITTFWARDAPGFRWSLLSAIVGIVIGLLLLVMPIEGAFLLAILLIAFFIAEGGASIMFALEHKRGLSGKWEWILVSGVIDLVLGVILFWYQWSAKAWAIGGLLVGINMVVGGVALIAMALHARNAPRTYHG